MSEASDFLQIALQVKKILEGDLNLCPQFLSYRELKFCMKTA